MIDAVIKVGGSLLRSPELRASAAAWAALATRHRLLIVPGGGVFADQVRDVAAELGLSPATSHWMAILAMEQYAYVLADLVPAAGLVTDLTAAAAACRVGRLAILRPMHLLQQAMTLPTSWDVTADSIAARIAHTAQAKQLILLKHTAGVLRPGPDLKPIVVSELPIAALAEDDIVDRYFVHALAAETTCWIIDGRYPQRLAELLAQGRTIGTRIVQSTSVD